MESIYVILVGSHVAEVNTLLTRSPLEMAHPAWNKKYSVQCLHATCSIDSVDDELILQAHVIVLCRGCQLPASKECYKQKPTLAIRDAAEECVNHICNEMFFYGTYNSHELCEPLLYVALTPLHVLFNKKLEELTPLGYHALERAFWLFDRDNDELMCLDELMHWRKLVSSTLTTDKKIIESLFQWKKQIQLVLNDELYNEQSESVTPNEYHVNTSVSSHKTNPSPVSENIHNVNKAANTSNVHNDSSTPNWNEHNDAQRLSFTEVEFIELHRQWLIDNEVTECWATLHASGMHPSALPFSFQDVMSVPRFVAVNTYLSNVAVQFFRNVYKLRYVASPAMLWKVTPGIPWKHITGFEEDVSEKEEEQEEEEEEYLTEHDINKSRNMGEQEEEEEECVDDEDLNSCSNSKRKDAHKANLHHVINKQHNRMDHSEFSNHHHHHNHHRRRRYRRHVLSLDTFIEYWKYFALEQPRVVVEYARYWGYKGDVRALFVTHKSRAFRSCAANVSGLSNTNTSIQCSNNNNSNNIRSSNNNYYQQERNQEVLPDTLQVLVIGSSRSGKKTLIHRLTHLDDSINDENDDITIITDNNDNNNNINNMPTRRSENSSIVNNNSQITSSKNTEYTNMNSSRMHSKHKRASSQLFVQMTTFFALRSTLSTEQEPQTIIYTSLAQDKVIPVLTNAFMNKTFDLVIMCIDADNFTKSCRYVINLYETVTMKKTSYNNHYNRQSNETECAQMPFVLVLTKGDKALKHAVARHKNIEELPMWKEMSLFCYRNRLLWPPLWTCAKESELIATINHNNNKTKAEATVNDDNNNDSNHNENGTDIMVQNMCRNVSELSEFVYTIARSPDVAVGPAPLTTVRVLRRMTFVSLLLLSFVAAVDYVRRKRSPKPSSSIDVIDSVSSSVA